MYLTCWQLGSALGKGLALPGAVPPPAPSSRPECSTAFQAPFLTEESLLLTHRPQEG